MCRRRRIAVTFPRFLAQRRRDRLVRRRDRLVRRQRRLRRDRFRQEMQELAQFPTENIRPLYNGGRKRFRKDISVMREQYRLGRSVRISLSREGVPGYRVARNEYVRLCQLEDVLSLVDSFSESQSSSNSDNIDSEDSDIAAFRANLRSASILPSIQTSYSCLYHDIEFLAAARRKLRFLRNVLRYAELTDAVESPDYWGNLFYLRYRFPEHGNRAWLEELIALWRYSLDQHPPTEEEDHSGDTSDEREDSSDFSSSDSLSTQDGDGNLPDLSVLDSPNP